MIDARGSFGSWKSSVTINLLIINVLMLIATTFFQTQGIDLDRILGLHYWKGSDFNLVQVITYMFLHAGFTHLFFNMFSLVMFGRVLESVLGSKRFLFYYISCGIGAALVQELVWTLTWEDTLRNILALQDVMGGAEAVRYATEHCMLNDFFNLFITIGASGAVFGILLAFGMIFPNMPLYLMFIPIPIKAKWMVLGYGLIELLFGINGGMDSSVAHFAHLGGMIFGFLILLYWKRKGVTGGRNY